MRIKISRDIVLLALLSTFLPSLAQASYLQFCQLDGEIISQPKQSDCCVGFEFLVNAAEAYEDPVFGEGWDGCDEYVGQKMTVKIVSGRDDDQEYSPGQTRLIWRYAVELEVNGEMSSVVGFYAVDPTAEQVEE